LRDIHGERRESSTPRGSLLHPTVGVAQTPGLSGRLKTLLGMAMNFLACDREQAFLMPPDPRDWLPDGHLAWFVLASVEEMDLSAFYGSYRQDGWGRAAFEPSLMVSLLLYSYARGERSSRGIERRCVEDVAYRVIAAQQTPDHATIARFRVRHETALAGLFGEVLGLCRESGLVNVGVIAIDGTKVHANASHHSNLDYEQLAREILKEAGEIDAAEDALYGQARGDELPEHLRTREGRRAALRAAKEKLAAKRAGKDHTKASGARRQGVKLVLDPEVIVPRMQGREGWLREARHQLDEHRRLQAVPIPRSRAERLLRAEQGFRENVSVERRANEAYEAYRARGVMKDGRRFGGPPKRYAAPETPPGKINTTDPDSRNVKTPRSYTQGYNVQAVVNERQIVLAAEVTANSADFGQLRPMVEAAKRELRAVGVTETPGVAVADSGYWNEEHMDHVIANEHVQVLIPPDAGKRNTPRPGWDGGRYTAMRNVLTTDHAGRLYRRRKAMVEPVFAQTKHNRRIDSFRRRGRSAALSEWRLITATHNLLKLHKHQTAAPAA
jgi:transposase